MKKIFLQKTSFLLLVAFFFIGFVAQAQDYVFKAEFGTSGSGNGQFESPVGLTEASNGDIFVISFLSGRLQFFDGTTYSYKDILGVIGSGDGQFRNPFDITTASNGDILVADTDNDRVQIFDGTTYAFKAKFGTSGTGNGEFRGLHGITTAPNGDIIITELFNNRVQVFDGTTYAFKSKFGTSGNGDGQFDEPRSVTVASNSDILVADTDNNRVQVFDGATYAFKTKFGTSGSGDGQFNEPYGITQTTNDDILITDASNNRVQVFDGTTYAFKSKFGTGGNGLVRYPIGVIQASNGDILVTAGGGDRVKIFELAAVPTINNNADINDPCACNLAGGLADGTFAETVTVTGTATGETWTVTAIAPLNVGGTAPVGIAVNDVLTDVGGNDYEITFDHSDLDGYNMTVRRSSDNLDLTISNVCATPTIAFNPAIAPNYLETDATVTLGANLTYQGIAAAGSPTYSLDGTNNITQLDFNPATTDLTIGQVSTGNYTVTGHYETDGSGTGNGGTLATPAVPTNACPVEASAAFMVGAPAPVPTLGEWGLIVLSLLLLNLGFVVLAAPKLATTTGQQIPPFSLNNIPFDLNQYAKMWAGTVVSMLAIFTIAIQGFGYELTSADPIGAVVSSFLVAYLVFLAKNEDKK